MVLKQLVETTNDATLDELYQLEQQTSVLIGRSTVDRMLTKLNNRQKNTPPYGKESERVQQQRFEFWQLMQGLAFIPDLH